MSELAVVDWSRVGNIVNFRLSGVVGPEGAVITLPTVGASMSNWTVTDLSGNIIRDGYDYAYISDEGMEVTEIAPPPEVPQPAWDQRPIDGARAMAAVRAMSRGGA
jgi:hypothetical protein